VLAVEVQSGLGVEDVRLDAPLAAREGRVGPDADGRRQRAAAERSSRPA
jgi:hypothetical protein